MIGDALVPGRLREAVTQGATIGHALCDLVIAGGTARQPIEKIAPGSSVTSTHEALTNSRVGLAHTPDWFSRALACDSESRQVEVGHVTINYRVWGDAELPGVILVHGAGACARWWDHIAPLLSGYRVVALDLSGHGDSEHRPGYQLSYWTAEVAAVATAEAMHRPILVGHSLGGRVSTLSAIAHPELFSRVVMIDTPLSHQVSLPAQPRAHRVYERVEDAVARFRTLPEQKHMLHYVREHIARHSLRAVRGGWTWKFDPRIFHSRPPFAHDLPKMPLPLALLRYEHGLIPEQMADQMVSLVGGSMPVVQLAGSGHHPMLDRPLELVAALRTLLSAWPSTP